jgi:signal peptidase I
MRRAAVVSSCWLGLAALGLPFARRQFVVVRVSGFSMLPALRPGDRVLVRRTAARRLTVGTIAVTRAQQPGSPRGDTLPPDRPWVIKRVAALPGDPVPGPVRAATAGIAFVPEGKLVLLSDNPDGTDSRHWGFVPSADLLGPVIARLRPDNARTHTQPGRSRRSPPPDMAESGL